MHAWMGNRQIFLVDDFFAVQRDVQIQGARRIRERALAAMPGFDLQQLFEQATRRQLGFDRRDGVDEIRLIRVAPRRAGVQRRCLQ